MILIDYNAIAISNVIAFRMEVEENLIRHSILNSLRMYRKKYHDKFGELVLTSDGPANWRKDVFPQYKFKRKKDRDSSTLDWNELFRITNMVWDELCETFPYKTIKHEKCEADDVISTLCEMTQEFGKYEDVMIISGDKDFAQLQRFNNVHQYSPLTKKLIKEDNPRLQRMNLVLKGDSSDGVPNVLSPDNTFVDNIRQSPMSKKKIEAMIEDPQSLGEEVYRNFQRNQILIDLEKTPQKYKDEIIYNYEAQDKWGNKGKVLPYLIEKRCRLLIEDIGDFI